MDVKGQGLIYGILMFSFAIIVSVLLAEPLSDISSSVTTSMNCASTGLSQGTYLTCIAVDFTMPFFIFVIVVLASVLITPKGDN